MNKGGKASDDRIDVKDIREFLMFSIKHVPEGDRNDMALYVDELVKMILHRSRIDAANDPGSGIP